jgi:hypothetical protein
MSWATALLTSTLCRDYYRVDDRGSILGMSIIHIDPGVFTLSDPTVTSRTLSVIQGPGREIEHLPISIVQNNNSGSMDP